MFFCAGDFLGAAKNRQMMLMNCIQGNLGEKNGKHSQGF